MKALRLGLGLILTIAAIPGFAAPVAYILGDHADGSLYDGVSTAGPAGPYGLRLDAIDPPAGNGPTFSAGDNLGGNGGPLILAWDDANLAAGAAITGSIYRNDVGDIWTVNYLLTGLTSDGNGGFTATAGSGSITNGTDVFAMTGKADGTGDVFVFADDGHRLPGSSGWVGRGWLDGSGTNDWLVTATVVPVPAAVWLFGSALGFLGWSRRKA